MKLNISESIRKLRREADMTQESVADSLGVTYQAVSRWENGQSYPDIELIPSLAALFGVDIDRLFGTDEKNVEAQIQKYHTEAESLESDDERIEHVKKYIDAFPGEVYFKMRLLDMYGAKDMDYTKKRLPEMRRLCRYVIDHTNADDWKRTNALINMICAEDDENIDEWMILLDRKSEVDSRFALSERYYYRNEVDKYNRLIQEDILNSFLHCFLNDFCKRDRETYKNARSRMEGQRIILRIIDVLRDPSTNEDGWIQERIFAYVRLSAGCFGCGEFEAGYDALKECLELCLVFSRVQKGNKLVFNSPALDELDFEAEGADFLKYGVIEPLTLEIGWEWFNCVRNEERFKQIVKSVIQLYEKMSAEEKLSHK